MLPKLTFLWYYELPVALCVLHCTQLILLLLIVSSILFICAFVLWFSQIFTNFSYSKLLNVPSTYLSKIFILLISFKKNAFSFSLRSLNSYMKASDSNSLSLKWLHFKYSSNFCLRVRGIQSELLKSSFNWVCQ